MNQNNNLPEKREDRNLIPTVLPDLFQEARRMFGNMDKLLSTNFLPNLLGEMGETLKVEETDQDYRITLQMQGIEHPDDVQYQFKNGVLIVQRTVEIQNKQNVDQGVIWQSHTEHFARTIPLPKPVIWYERQVTAENGVWKLIIPKD